MATITIRKLGEQTKEWLRLRAAEHRRSMEEEPRRSSGRLWLRTLLSHPVIVVDTDVRAAIDTRNVSDLEHCGVDIVDPWNSR